MRGDSRQPRAATRPRSGLPILLGVITGLALCAAIYFAMTLAAGPAPDPAPTARAICADLTAQRYDSLYSLLAPNVQSQGSEAEFSASQRELDSLLGSVHECQASIASNTGGAASVTLALRRGEAAPVNAHVALVQTSGHWRITSYDDRV